MEKQNTYTWDVTILDDLKNSSMTEMQRDYEILFRVNKSMGEEWVEPAREVELRLRLGDAADYIGFWPKICSPLNPSKFQRNRRK